MLDKPGRPSMLRCTRQFPTRSSHSLITGDLLFDSYRGHPLLDSESILFWPREPKGGALAYLRIQRYQTAMFLHNLLYQSQTNPTIGAHIPSG